MRKIAICLLGLLCLPVNAFVLVNPKHKLHKAETAKVMISSEGCSANGVSDSEVKTAIKWAVEFWNDVPESRLKLKYGGKSSASINDTTTPKNQIIVGCGPLPSVNILGATSNDTAHGSARIVMNEAVYTGDYNSNSFIGTLTHEVGHGLGLAHSNDAASVMTYVSHGWVDRPKYISQDDIDGVVYLYPNEKEIGGLMGSCSSFAGDSSNPQHMVLETLMGFLAMLLLSWVIKKLLFRDKQAE